MNKAPGLTHKQLLFCQEYIVDLNASAAARRAGYSEDTAGAIGAENLKKPQISEKIQEYMDLRSKRLEITADRVLAELGKIGFADIRKIMSPGNGLIDIKDLDDDIAAAIAGIEVVTRDSGERDDDKNPIPEYVHKIKLTDKKGALELIGRHLAIYRDRVEHDVGDNLKTLIIKDLSGSNGGTD